MYVTRRHHNITTKIIIKIIKCTLYEFFCLDKSKMVNKFHVFFLITLKGFSFMKGWLYQEYQVKTCRLYSDYV